MYCLGLYLHALSICGTCARGTDEEIIDSIFMQRRTFPAVHPPLDKTALRLSTEFVYVYVYVFMLHLGNALL